MFGYLLLWFLFRGLFFLLLLFDINCVVFFKVLVGMGVLVFIFLVCLNGVWGEFLDVILFEIIWNLIEEVGVRGVIVVGIFCGEEVRVMICDMNFMLSLWKFFNFVL